MSNEGRCKEYINTQLGARGYSTPSNIARGNCGQLDLPYGALSNDCGNMKRRRDGEKRKESMKGRRNN